MVVASSVRRQIEDALASRVLGALSPRQQTATPHLASGVVEVDELLRGGLHAGAITEVVGSSCSGRTSFALAFIAGLTSAGQATAWIDVADAFDPESAAAAGVDLYHLLWIRCGSNGEQLEKGLAKPSDVRGFCYGKTWTNSAFTSGGSPHPRNEARGMPKAIQALSQHDVHLLKKSDAVPANYLASAKQNVENPAETRRRRKNIGTPGMPNRLLRSGEDSTFVRRTLDRTEQAPTDRQPPRRGEHFQQLPRFPVAIVSNNSETLTIGTQAQQENRFSKSTLNKVALYEQTQFVDKTDTKRSKAWKTLDQAVRASDLLLSAGGFSALVLDLGSTPPEFSSRIPVATWFRFRAAAKRSRTTILLLTRHPCTSSSAGTVLHYRTLNVTTAGNLITGMNYEVSLNRQRSGTAEEQHNETGNIATMRKWPQSERYATCSLNTAWVPFAERAREKQFACAGR